MILLAEINETTIKENLRIRYERDHIYVSILCKHTGLNSTTFELLASTIKAAFN